MRQPLGTNDAVSVAIEKYANMVRRICFLYLKDYSDVEDVFQEVFLKFFLNTGKFESPEHEKNWLCRVTFNKCKDLCRSFWRKKVVSIEEMDIPYESPAQEEMIKFVLQLPTEYKDLIYLHYYEGRTIPEVAEILQENVNTVYSRLKRGKALLKRKLGDDFTLEN